MRAKDDSPDHMNSNRIKNSSSQIRKEAGLDRGPRNRTISDAEDLFMKSKELVLDKKEPIIVATYLLPYNIEREKSGQLVINQCFHNPTLLYGTLESMMQKGQFNFHWVGLVTTLEDMSD